MLSSPVYGQGSSEQDSTGLPGDNFSLQGALEMFQKASSPEEFERSINTGDNHVNNLDLNDDGEVDYVRVIDKMDKDVHAFVLQVPVSETENRDVAVIELEKTGENSAVVQIIGDEDIYGEQKIIEPKGKNEEDAMDEEGGGNGPSVTTPPVYSPAPVVVVNVWAWPCVRFVYAPAYRVWVSPWRGEPTQRGGIRGIHLPGVHFIRSAPATAQDLPSHERIVPCELTESMSLRGRFLSRFTRGTRVQPHAIVLRAQQRSSQNPEPSK